jgi:hypothetical protein
VDGLLRDTETRAELREGEIRGIADKNKIKGIGFFTII